MCRAATASTPVRGRWRRMARCIGDRKPTRRKCGSEEKKGSGLPLAIPMRRRFNEGSSVGQNLIDAGQTEHVSDIMTEMKI